MGPIKPRPPGGFLLLFFLACVGLLTTILAAVSLFALALGLR
jgi:hypothetical protein